MAHSPEIQPRAHFSEIHREKAYEDYLDRWTQLFECLSLQNLTLLEVHARSFARSLRKSSSDECVVFE